MGGQKYILFQVTPLFCRMNSTCLRPRYFPTYTSVMSSLWNLVKKKGALTSMHSLSTVSLTSGHGILCSPRFPLTKTSKGWKLSGSSALLEMNAPPRIVNLSRNMVDPRYLLQVPFDRLRDPGEREAGEREAGRGAGLPGSEPAGRIV